MKNNIFKNLYEMNVIGINTLIKCKYFDKIFGDVIGIITDVFLINNIEINDDEILITCTRNYDNKKFKVKPENIIEVDGMAIERLESLFLKKKKKIK